LGEDNTERWEDNTERLDARAGRAADHAVTFADRSVLRDALQARLRRLPAFHPSSPEYGRGPGGVLAGDRAGPGARRASRARQREAPGTVADRPGRMVAPGWPAGEAGRRSEDGRRGDHRPGDGQRDQGQREQGQRDGGADRPGAPQERSGADAPDRAFWNQVGRLERVWAQHLARWPEAPGERDAAGRRPGDPPGSWRGEGGRYLDPGQNALADRMIARLREPESQVSRVLRLIERENPHGGRLMGFEHRLKGEQRLKEKIADKLTARVGMTPEEAIGHVGDAVRYTFCFDRERYVRGCEDVRRRLEAAGYAMIHRKDGWRDDPEYKGINTRWQTPAGGRFELQFHTPESFYAKESLTHRAYRRLRSLAVTRAERHALEDYQRLVSAAIPRPPGVTGFREQEGDQR